MSASRSPESMSTSNGRSVAHATGACDPCKNKKKRCTVSKCAMCIIENMRECHHGPCERCLSLRIEHSCQWTMPDKRRGNRRDWNYRDNGRAFYPSPAITATPEHAGGQEARRNEHRRSILPISVLHASWIPTSLTFHRMALPVDANYGMIPVGRIAAPNALNYPATLWEDRGASTIDEELLQMQEFHAGTSPSPTVYEDSTTVGHRSAQGTSFPYQVQVQIQQNNTSDVNSLLMHDSLEEVSDAAFSTSHSPWTADPLSFRSLLQTRRVQNTSIDNVVTQYP